MRRGIGWLAAVAVLGCTTGPGREDAQVGALYVGLCERLASCGCLSAEEATACGSLSEIFDTGQGGTELAFDPECFEHLSQLVRTHPCDEPFEFSYRELCPLYHGTLLEGQECGDRIIGVDGTGGISVEEPEECGRNTYCIQGRCTDPSTIEFGGLGEPCDLNGCDEGLACQEGVCLTIPGPGQPCAITSNGQTLCAEGSRCDDAFDTTPLCEAVAEVGAPCTGHAQCASGNCPNGRCAPPAGIGGECSFQLPCADDLSCVDNVCVPDDLGGAAICDAVVVFDGGF